MTTRDYFLGLDLGQASDPSALAILERTTTVEKDQPSHRFGCRALKRWPLGTPYPAIVTDMGALVSKPPLRNAHLVIDATGVGRPVVDMFVQVRLPVHLVPVMITSGTKVTFHDGYFHVAKVLLISTVLRQLQERRLRFARALPETDTLIHELRSYRVKITAAANETFNARQGEHDDLVLALALAAWKGERSPPTTPFRFDALRPRINAL